MDTYIEAEYQDGYIHSELELNDISAWEPEKRNTFYDIINKLPEPEHGPMVRFSLVHAGNHYDIDWTKVPAGARPIAIKNKERDFNIHGWLEDARIVGADFGYQWTDEQGNHKKVENL